jgi:hypothetical protein
VARRLSVSLLLLGLALGTGSATAAHRPAPLPPETLRGPETRLQEYPSVSLATRAQRAAAVELLRQIRSASRDWPTLTRARSAGFDTHTVRRRARDRTVHYLHAEHRRGGYGYLDPRHPKALIYANLPTGRLVFVGVMFSMPRGLHGRTPGGPITRWHTHRVCASGGRRGLAPRRDGSCPPGTKARQGSEMMHVWLTRDLRSAFAIHAPTRELGLAHLLPAAFCRL